MIFIAILNDLSVFHPINIRRVTLNDAFKTCSLSCHYSNVLKRLQLLKLIKINQILQSEFHTVINIGGFLAGPCFCALTIDGVFDPERS